MIEYSYKMKLEESIYVAWWHSLSSVMSSDELNHWVMCERFIY